MKLKITTDYAIRLLLCLSAAPGKLTAEELSEKTAIPKPTVIKVMGRLKTRNWVSAREGVRGGYTLVAPLEEIALMDVFSAMSETITINRCHAEACIPGYAPDNCPVRNTYDVIQSIVEGMFRSTTLAMMLRGDLGSLESVRDAAIGASHCAQPRLNAAGESA
ncbi:MAG: RrF2 family transcriptional regulator [Christensenellales bacterium]